MEFQIEVLDISELPAQTLRPTFPLEIPREVCLIVCPISPIIYLECRVEWKQVGHVAGPKFGDTYAQKFLVLIGSEITI